MEIRPIVASLNKHRIPTLLIILEIALACAVLCNAVFMISRRLEAMQLPNAIDAHGIISIDVRGTDPKLASSDVPRNLAALRSIAGVDAATITHSLPLSQSNWGWSFSAKPDAGMTDQHNTNITLYFVSNDADKALGLQLKQGRFFNSTEYADSMIGDAALPTTHEVIVTETLAKQLWPGQSALGKTIYSKPYYFTVVGVVADVLRPWVYTQDIPKSYYAGFFPVGPDAALSEYIVHTAPADRDRVMEEAIRKLQDINPQAVVNGKTFDTIRDSFFANAKSMVWILTLVCAVMLAVTAFGIIGLTSFWVGQRRRQIGIRRAVGATRGDIMRYFRTENFLLSTAGVVIGMVLAFGINLYLMKQYEMSRMPWYYLPGGAIALWFIGQLSVSWPALRAAAVPPVVAIRSA
jgi:putative ABC transport system permease protein